MRQRKLLCVTLVTLGALTHWKQTTTDKILLKGRGI